MKKLAEIVVTEHPADNLGNFHIVGTEVKRVCEDEEKIEKKGDQQTNKCSGSLH